MKLIYKNENRAIVYSVKNILKLNNIDSHVKNEYGQTMGGGLGLSNSLLELWLINDHEYEKAKSIIAAQSDKPTNLRPWICDKCGEENEGNFGACWKCQHEHTLSAPPGAAGRDNDSRNNR
jgi:hypothetical protein